MRSIQKYRLVIIYDDPVTLQKGIGPHLNRSSSMESGKYPTPLLQLSFSTVSAGLSAKLLKAVT